MNKTTDMKIEQAHQEWMAALNAVEEPIFMHDKNFRILRCNRAYQKCAGISFAQIIGRPYYDVFPKTHTPLHHCLRETEDTVEAENEEEVQVGDTLFRSHAYAIKDEKGNYLYSMHILEDITERQRIQRAMQTSETQYRRLFEAAKDGIVILDAETGVIVDANPFILNLLAYRLDEFTGKKLWEIGLFADTEASKAIFLKLQSKKYIRYDDLQLKMKNGRQIDVEFVSNLYEVNGRKILQCNIRDITERLRMREMLIASHDLFQSVVENTSVRVFWKDADLRYLGCNTAFAHDAGMSSPQELVGKDDFQMSWRDQAELYRTDDKKVMDSGIPKMGYEEPQTTPDGRQIWLRTSKIPLRATDGDIFGILGIYDDITEHKQDEERLKLFRTLLDHSNDSIEVIEPLTMRFLDVNDTDCRILGYSREEMLSMSVFDIDPLFDADAVKTTEEQLRQSKSAHFESVHRRKDGSTFPVEVNTKLIELDKSYILSIVRDITERKVAEESLRRANRALKTLLAANETLVRASSEEELLQTVTNIIVEQGGYSLAVVDYPQDDPDKSITPMAWSGLEEKSYWAKNLSWDDTEHGQLPVSKVMRGQTTKICRNIVNDPVFKLWRDAAISHGYISNISLPLSEGGKTFGALSIYSSETNTFDDEEVHLLEELANDLAYGIITLRTRIAHEQQATILQKSLEQSIQTIASTVEMRDPYTAGHQRRVGELATAIGQEMGLPEEQINGIHLAAIIHDLGKIRVPAEILSKPGKLSEPEFMLIKAHPQAGYDILKDVKFPWPIADIILQHHEKVDGSGYPQGLKGDQIRLEAKIISVADVVEAMSTHRPYRSALGIEQALDEIRKGRGSAYDPSVVDACLKLFTDKGFAFSSES